MPWKVLVGLILCNFLWSANPTWGKVILTAVSPEITAWLRYSSSLLSYVVAVSFLQVTSRIWPKMKTQFDGPYFMKPKARQDWLLLLALGFMTFCFSPFLQFTGLSTSRASENALIIAIEPLITVGMACLFLREKLSSRFLACLILALFGFFMLAGLDPAHGLAADLKDAHLIGNLLILCALLGEASFSVLGRKLQDRNYGSLEIFGSALIVGALSLTVTVLLKSGYGAFAQLLKLNVKTLAAIFFLGPIGTALTYFFWMLVLRQATVASMALTLFVQPIMGSIWGYCFLDERLTLMQVSGALLIALAVLIQSVNSS